MKATNIPSRVPLPFASSGSKNAIPTASQIGITPGAASLTDGFPPLTRTPLAAGGVPPSGKDFNGILNLVTAVQQWQSAGGLFTFDSTFSTSVGGYPMGAILASAAGTGLWLSLVDDNTVDPDANPGSASWASLNPGGDSTQNFEAANATAGTQQLVPIAQGDLRYILSSADGSAANYEHLTASHTLVASDSGKVFDFWNATSNVTLTYNTALPGFTCTVVAPQNYSVTISLAAGDLSIPGKALIAPPTTLTVNPQETAYIVSFSQGGALYVFKTGRTIVADAINSNEAVALGQSLLGGSRTNQTANRAVDTTYTNSGSYPKIVDVNCNTAATASNLSVWINGAQIWASQGAQTANSQHSVEFVVLPNETYKITGASISLTSWWES